MMEETGRRVEAWCTCPEAVDKYAIKTWKHLMCLWKGQATGRRCQGVCVCVFIVPICFNSALPPSLLLLSPVLISLLWAAMYFHEPGWDLSKTDRRACWLSASLYCLRAPVDIKRLRQLKKIKSTLDWWSQIELDGRKNKRHERSRGRLIDYW